MTTDTTSQLPVLPDDTELVALLKSGHHSALSRLYARYSEPLRRFVLNILRREDWAEEVVQDVFCALWDARDNYDTDGPAKLSTWLFRVAVFKCADMRRKLRSDMEHFEEESFAELLHSAEEPADILLRNTIQALLAELPTMQRRALMLHYYQDQDVAQICRQLDLSEQSVRSLLKRGKQTLRERAPTL